MVVFRFRWSAEELQHIFVGRAFEWFTSNLGLILVWCFLFIGRGWVTFLALFFSMAKFPTYIVEIWESFVPEVDLVLFIIFNSYLFSSEKLLGDVYLHSDPQASSSLNAFIWHINVKDLSQFVAYHPTGLPCPAFERQVEDLDPEWAPLEFNVLRCNVSVKVLEQD